MAHRFVTPPEITYEYCEDVGTDAMLRQAYAILFRLSEGGISE